MRATLALNGLNQLSWPRDHRQFLLQISAEFKRTN